MDDITFYPGFDIQGFRVFSDFEIDKVECQEINQNIYQLAIILYPKDKINEKFLLKIRSCFSRISRSKVLTEWMGRLNFNYLSKTDDQNKMDFLKDLTHSSFNLVTDEKIREKIKVTILEIKGDSLGRKILKSYLYLMLGYVVRSDILIKEILSSSPFEFWKGNKDKLDVYDLFVHQNLEQMLKKFRQHPHDRRIFTLLCGYFREFFSIHERYPLTKKCEFEDDLIKDNLAYFKKLAPEFVTFLSFRNEDDKKLRELLFKKGREDTSFYVHWLWPIWVKMDLFLPEINEQLEEIENENEIFLHYLIQGESLKDSYLKLKNKTFLHGRISNLHKHLEKNELFMLSLFKLIEYGNIDRHLTERLSKYLQDNGL